MASNTPSQASIVEPLRPLAVAIDSLRPLDGNPRRGDVPAVERSLARFGQRKPIVVRSSDRQIVAGNHTWQAARNLGWSEIAAVFVDDDEATAKAFALADNRTSDLGSYDNEALAALVAEVAEVDLDLLTAASMNAYDVAELVDAIDSPTDFPSFDESVPTEHVCPKCNYRWSGK